MKLTLKKVSSFLKPYFSWVLFLGVGFFLAKTLETHWQKVLAIQISHIQWHTLSLALVVTLFAHCWSGWVWGWLLKAFHYPVTPQWSICVYLKTNIAKYVPGNMWHFYGRANAALKQGIPLEVATLSVLLEPLLMAAAALILALIAFGSGDRPLLFISLPLILLSLHPLILTPLVTLLKKLKLKNQETSEVKKTTYPLQYPFLPLVGELIFVMLRSGGFLLTLLALHPLDVNLIPQLVSAFSIAWLLGLVIPGAPGGLGVFEGTALALLQGKFLMGITLYRLISTLAEALGALLAYVIEWVRKSSTL